MKRVITSVILTLIILVFCISSGLFLNKYVGNVSDKLNTIYKCVLNDDKDRAAYICKDIVSEYQSKEKFLMSCMNHDDLEKIPATAVECENLLRYSDEKAFVLAKIAQLQIVLDDIKETNIVSFFNIF